MCADRLQRALIFRNCEKVWRGFAKNRIFQKLWGSAICGFWKFKIHARQNKKAQYSKTIWISEQKMIIFENCKNVLMIYSGIYKIPWFLEIWDSCETQNINAEYLKTIKEPQQKMMIFENCKNVCMPDFWYWSRQKSGMFKNINNSHWRFWKSRKCVTWAAIICNNRLFLKIRKNCISAWRGMQKIAILKNDGNTRTAGRFTGVKH